MLFAPASKKSFIGKAWFELWIANPSALVSGTACKFTPPTAQWYCTTTHQTRRPNHHHSPQPHIDSANSILPWRWSFVRSLPLSSPPLPDRAFSFTTFLFALHTVSPPLQPTTTSLRSRSVQIGTPNPTSRPPPSTQRRHPSSHSGNFCRSFTVWII